MSKSGLQETVESNSFILEIICTKQCTNYLSFFLTKCTIECTMLIEYNMQSIMEYYGDDLLC